jgi:hypothetical protein
MYWSKRGAGTDTIGGVQRLELITDQQKRAPASQGALFL